MTARPPGGPSPETTVLEHLYAAMYCLLLLSEAVSGRG